MKKRKLQVERYQSKNLPTIWLTRVGEHWITQSDYLIEVPVRNESLLIPIGFRFDLASVPRWAWTLIAPFELSLIAPLVHDYFYSLDGAKRIPGWDSPVTREEADEIFLALMLIEGVPKWKAHLAYRAVRLASWIWW